MSLEDSYKLERGKIDILGSNSDLTLIMIQYRHIEGSNTFGDLISPKKAESLEKYSSSYLEFSLVFSFLFMATTHLIMSTFD